MSEDTIADVADRLEHAADRYDNAEDPASAQAAREAAAAARKCTTLEDALRVERAFLELYGVLDRPAPPRPRAGLADGRRFVIYGSRARAGGSVGWRNNNPGYLRCGDWAVDYGALACDGEWAIFPDEETGLEALMRWLTERYPDEPLDQALRQQLPPEAPPGAAEQIEKKAGVDPETKVGEMSEEQLRSLAEAFRDEGAEAGESFDRDEGAPDWMEGLWEAEAVEGAAVTEDTASDAAEAPSDDS
jgi:hypothetical protein